MRLESHQDAILGHVERMEALLGVQNGRIGKAEESLSQTTAALTTHLNQVNDRQEFDRLVGLERRVSAMERDEEKGKSIQAGQDIATKKFTAIMAAGVAIFMGVATWLQPLAEKLLGF